MIAGSAERRILILSQFYLPEPCAAAHRVRALARALAAHGNHVTVLTAMPSFPDGRVRDGYRRKHFVEERDGDVHVHRVWAFASSRVTALTRLANWATVACGMLLYLLVRKQRNDVVIVSSPPITLAIPALFAAWQSRGALVADIRDVFPDVGVRMGRWSQGGVLTRTLGTLADRLYARSSLVVAVTNTARAAIVARRVPAAKVIVAMNGADRVSVAREAVFSRTDGAFVIAYVGNMGVATGLDALLDAARILPQNRFKFLLVGAGAQQDRLRTRVEREEIRNVDFLGVLPRENAARVLADANACIVPLAAGIRDSLPTKIFDALSVGCPVIVAAEGEARDFIVASGGGICVPPEDGHALASAICRLAEDRALCERLSRSGREHLRSRYSRATIMNDLAARIVSGNLGHQTKAS